MTSDEAVEAAISVFPWQAADYLDNDTVRAALEAAAPHMQPDLLEEWAVQFSNGSVEESEDEADARRKLSEIRECIADGIETPALEPMRIVQRYRVASSELTEWKERTNPYRSQA